MCHVISTYPEARDDDVYWHLLNSELLIDWKPMHRACIWMMRFHEELFYLFNLHRFGMHYE